MTSKKDKKTTKEKPDNKKETLLDEEETCMRGKKDCFNCKILDCPEEE
jgi:hypothetical protein